MGITFYVAAQVRNYRWGKKVNYQELIMKWLFRYQSAVKNVTADNAIWQILAIPEGDTPAVNVAVLKTEPDFIKIGIGGGLNPVEKQGLAELTSQPDSTLIEELRIEIGRLGIEFKGINHPLSDVYLAQSMAMDDTLAQLSFMQTFMRVRQAWVLYQNVVIKYRKMHGITKPSTPDKEGSPS